MTPTVLPTPGWLARTGSGYGQETTLCLLAGGLLIGTAGGDPEEFYRGCADAGTFELKEILLGLWAEFTGDYPYLKHTTPLTNWLHTADPAGMAAAGRLAGILADVDIAGADRQVGGDLLGRVYDEMLAINRRLQRPLRIYPLPVMATAAWVQLESLKKIIAHNLVYSDMACLSGVRAVGALIALSVAGIDPDTLKIQLRDPDPNWIAIAATNLALVAYKGEPVLAVGRAFVNPSPNDDRFFLHAPGEQPMVATPEGWDCMDWEIAKAEAVDRLEHAIDTADRLVAGQYVQGLGVAGKTLPEIMAEVAAEEGGYVDDSAVDYGPRRPTRPRVKGRKRVKGKRKR